MLVFLSVSWRPRIHEQGSARCGGTSLFLVGGVVWNGRYLNILVIINKVLSDDSFSFLSTCCRFFIPVEFVVYLFFNKDEKNEDDDDDDDNDNNISGLVGVPCKGRAGLHNQEPSTHPPTTDHVFIILHLPPRRRKECQSHRHRQCTQRRSRHRRRRRREKALKHFLHRWSRRRSSRRKFRLWQ